MAALCPWTGTCQQTASKCVSTLVVSLQCFSITVLVRPFLHQVASSTGIDVITCVSALHHQLLRQQLCCEQHCRIAGWAPPLPACPLQSVLIEPALTSVPFLGAGWGMRVDTAMSCTANNGCSWRAPLLCDLLAGDVGGMCIQVICPYGHHLVRGGQLRPGKRHFLHAPCIRAL
eukprot:scaffold36083_cov19-Tisochrysis_lutea.AAC.1